MPRFDGTGPRGMGPMTGGGRGFCAVTLGTYGSAYGYGPGYFPYRGYSAYPRYAWPFSGSLFGAGRAEMLSGGGRGRLFGGPRGFRRW